MNANDFLGDSDPASSVFLQLLPSDETLQLNWNFDVPWFIEQNYIYRLNEETDEFVLIDSTTENTYLDTGLSNDSIYCYKVETIGNYTAEGLKSPLINFSQEACANPKDTIPPCAPVLSVNNYCIDDNLPQAFVNFLSWIIPTDCIDSNIVSYQIFFKPTREGVFEQIGTVDGKDNRAFEDELDNTLTGCYAIRAVDPSGNISEFSDSICVSDCPDYKLPNAFTPNNDGVNDIYTPIVPYSGVNRIKMKIFNRWGNLVYETEDPDINWDGTDFKTGKPLPTAAYYYVCEVFFNTLDGEQQLEEPLSGYIHLFRER